MQIDEIREYCLAKRGVYEETPFGPQTLTFKVMEKIFLFLPLDEVQPKCSIKGDPDRWVELREQYSEIYTGPYLNKKHWSLIECDGAVPDKLLYELIDRSYELVVKGLTKKQRDELDALEI